MVENNPGLSCLVYYSDLMAFGGLDYLHEAGLRERISLIGFDGFEMTFQVGLTTVVQPMERMGEEGARILLAKISGASSERVSTLLDPWLYKGATCMRVSDEQ
jgi:DNA-binding LacI/PurR family transcriptional regulator